MLVVPTSDEVLVTALTTSKRNEQVASLRAYLVMKLDMTHRMRAGFPFVQFEHLA
ncbi:hypothetical protein [Streptomyces sp. NPDC047869]|uniref:hypothetical protein n=1 Tax=Streptomyces sp. NPDC047869 TaxID=3154709 RepID=UPI0034547231